MRRNDRQPLPLARPAGGTAMTPVLVLLVILAVLWNINQRLVWIDRSVRGTPAR